MNKSYRTIWNEALGSWVAASENAAARGKRNKAKVCAVVATAVVAAASWAPVAHAQYNAGGGVAKGSKSIAIGSGATTDGSQDGNIAIGDKASANSGTSANAYSATAIGLDATAAGDGTVALGDAASATADRATAIGRFAHADGVKSSALGSNAYAFELGSTAVGAESFASAQGATALGFTSVAAGQNSVAVGFGATSIGDAGIAIGQLANSKGNASLAMGTYASSTGDSSTAIGLEARSEGDWSTALGYQAYTAGIRSTALGNQSFSEGKGSTALGDRTKSTGDWSAAVGSYAESAGINSAAVGALASSSGDFSAAVGSNARSEGYGSIALGLNSSALEDRSVALGAGSIADRGDAVSVGNATLKRQITNMAAGTLSDSSTDAVNGSQLYATNQNVTANTTNITDLDSRVTTVDNRVTSIDGRVTNVEGSVTNLTQQLDSGSVGLVQQDATSKAITVARDLDGTTVDFAGANGVRTLGGVKAGALSDISTEAVNGSQLHATNQNVTANTTNIASNTTAITSLDSRVSTVDNRVTSIDGRVTNVEGSVTNLTQQLDSGSVGLVQQDATSKAITVAKGLDGTTVDFTGANGVRTLSGVKAGALSDTSTEVVNGSQLHATNQNVTANTTNIASNTTAITSLDSRVTNVEGSVTNLTQQLDSGSVGLVQQDATSKAITVAKGLDGTMVDFTGTEGVRALGGVKAGALSDTSTEAVNGSQLHATNQNVTANTTNIASNTTAITSLDSRVSTVDDRVASIDGRVTNVEGSVTNLTQQLDGGSVGLVQQDATSKAITVAKGLDGTMVDFTGTEGVRALSGVKAGALSDTSTEAVNGSQLHATNQAIANASRYFKAGGLEDGTDDAIAAAKSVAVGAGASANVGSAATANWNNPLVSGNGSNTDINGVAIGANSRASLGGIALGDTAVSDSYSGVALGAYTVAGSHGTAVGAGAMAEGADSSALGYNALATGGSAAAMGNFSTASGDKSAALGAKANAQAANSVALGADSIADRDDAVSVGNATLKRQITNVAAGTLSASSTDAVNGSQLYGTASSVAQALGGGSTVNPDGTISAPSYSVGGTTVHSISDAVTNIDGRTTRNASDIEQNTATITNVQNRLADGSVGLVQQDATTRDITVAKDTDGTVVNMAGTAGDRTVTGVAAGAVNASSVDAVNGGQLYGTASSMAQALGGGSTMNADGTISAPSYSVLRPCIA
ncbi:ESPR-type extended signal peptide-containing protein [Paraburkholderia sp. WSM4179]|uniref:ESPR-type extended signal peptide-containing protein n=1 Tax=unclassified Paraburkholderia TaxID=2615204 RepID=UPI002475B1A9|nr:ESPR-type extended signal peptide-containing protein [Paraburkholderia sp. WSM4179]MDH6147912.1 autotransporter adhesin [Paraburkholderia sp. WSM4179]